MLRRSGPRSPTRCSCPTNSSRCPRPHPRGQRLALGRWLEERLGRAPQVAWPTPVYEARIDRVVAVPGRRYDEPMTSQLRVLVEQPTQGKRWSPSRRTGRVSNGAPRRRTRPSRSSPATCRDTSRSRSASAWARRSRADRPRHHRPLPGTRLDRLLGHLVRTLAARPRAVRPADLRSPVRLLRAAWVEFDETAARVSAELRLGVRGGGRSRDQIVRHVLATEGGDFSARVKVKSELDEPPDARRARASPRPLRRGDARLVRGRQAARQMDDPVPASPHGIPRARPHLGDAGPGPDGRRLRRMTVPGGTDARLHQPRLQCADIIEMGQGRRALRVAMEARC